MAKAPFTIKIPGADSVEPAVTPIAPGSPQTSFLKKPKIASSQARKKDIPKGVWTKCPQCANLIFDKELDQNQQVCHHCHHHFSIGSWDRVQLLVEPGSFEEIDPDLTSVDILEFTGVATYTSKLEGNRKKTGLKDAAVCGTARVGSHAVALGVMDFSFLGGSMGSVVGEKLTRLIELGTEKGLPVVIFSTSGGARMYEGMFSLMQMAKTCGALAYHARAGLPFISYLTHPTYAGVMASFASVGDLILAEPGAKIGFAGERVIKDTTQAQLPAGFQTAEFLLERGLIDAIVPRAEMKSRLTFYLDFLMTSGAKHK